MDYFKKATKTLPAIIMDSGTKSALIKGVSIEEDWATYEQIMNEIKFQLNQSSYTDFNIQLKVFNPKTAKLLIDLLKSIKLSKPSLLIHWIYSNEDEEMKEMGQDYSDLLEMNFILSAN